MLLLKHDEKYRTRMQNDEWKSEIRMSKSEGFQCKFGFDSMNIEIETWHDGLSNFVIRISNFHHSVFPVRLFR